MAQFAHHPCLVAKGVHIEGGDEVFVSVCLETPGHRRSGGETEVADRQVLRVVIVAPVGVEQPYRPVPEPVFGRVSYVAEAIVGTTGDRVPRRGARTYEERYARPRELGPMLLERMVGLVAPLEHYRIFRQFRHQIRMLDDDVSPVVHRATVMLDQVVDPEQVIEVDAARALLLDGLSAPSLPHVPGRIAAHVELTARE